MKKVLIISLALLLFSNVYARRGEGRMGDGDRGCVFSTLNLTAKQKDKMIEIKKKNRDRTHEIRKEMQDVRFEMMKALEDDFDEAKAKSYVEKISNLEKEKMMIKIDLIKEVKSILNEEQFKMMKLMRLWGPHKMPHFAGKN